MKIILCGHGRDGKDTMAEHLRDRHGMKFCSSSMFACEKAVYPILKEKYHYDTPEACFEDRHNHRAEWYDLITAYNNEDRARLAKELFKEHDIYVGLRNIEELKEARKLADCVIWIDASKRNPDRESTSSNTISPWDCDLTITNNGTLDEFFLVIDNFVKNFKAGQ